MVEEKLLTNEARYIRHMTYNKLCQICGKVGEPILHAIRDYQVSSKVWMRIIKPGLWSRFF